MRRMDVKFALAAMAALALSACARDSQMALDQCRTNPGCVNSGAASGYGPSHAQAIESGQGGNPQR
jgi:hypothetical protein